MEKHCIHALVSGRVQGVFFRDNTRSQAIKRNLTGWVKNLPNGKVELVACGEHEEIMDLIKWLWKGSSFSKVTHVEWETVKEKDFDDFTVTY